MRASVWRPDELGDGERRRWSCFQRGSLELQHPCLSHAFARAVATVSDRARVAVFEDAGATVGFLAYEQVSRGLAVPIGRATNIRQAFVHDPQLEWDWSDVLQAAGLDVLQFGDLVGSQRAGRRTLDTAASPVISTRDGWDAYFASVRRHRHVKTTLYKERRMRREFDDVTVDAGAGDAADLDALGEWKSRQYRRSGWPDLFARRWVPELLEVIAAFEGDGLCAVGTSLRVDGRVVATDLSLASATVFAGWFAAYDPEYARCSPGAVRTMHTLRHAFERGVSMIDLHRGDEAYKHTLQTGDVDVAAGYVSLPSVRTFGYRIRHTPASSARSYVLRHPRVRQVVRASLRSVGSARDAVNRQRSRSTSPR